MAQFMSQQVASLLASQSFADSVAWFSSYVSRLGGPGLSLVISTIALLVSAYTLFQQHLKPFRLIGAVGSISILPDHPGGRSGGALLYVPILLRNVGARAGRLSDLVVAVSHGAATAVCEPVGFFDLSKWLVTAVAKKPPYVEALTGVFVPPILGGRETQALHVAFTCDDMDKILAWLGAGNVTFRVLARNENDKTYLKLAERAEGSAHSDIANVLSGGQALVMLDPSNNTLRKLLQKP